MTIAILIIGAVLGAILSVIAAILFQNSLEDFLLRALGRFSPDVAGRRLAGEWTSYYEVFRPDEPPPIHGDPLVAENLARVEFHRVGRSVLGTSVGAETRYRLRLKLRDSAILTGTWSDTGDNGRYHFGAVQFNWHYDGNAIVGRFVGRDRNNVVNHGYWVLASDEDHVEQLLEGLRPRAPE